VRFRRRERTGDHDGGRAVFSGTRETLVASGIDLACRVFDGPVVCGRSARAERLFSHHVFGRPGPDDESCAIVPADRHRFTSKNSLWSRGLEGGVGDIAAADARSNNDKTDVCIDIGRRAVAFGS